MDVNGQSSINRIRIQTKQCFLSHYLLLTKAFEGSKISFYDQTFAFLRHKVSFPTIKRFHFYDVTFAFLYRKVYSTHRICVMAMWNHLELWFISHLIVITLIDNLAMPKPPYLANICFFVLLKFCLRCS